MDFLSYNNSPEGLREPTLLFAFAGWADAADSATHALKYLVRSMKGEKFAEIDPEEFYNFTRVRPKTKFDEQGERYIEWPTNAFYSVRCEDADTDLVGLVGVEPNVRWKTFSKGIVDTVKALGIVKVIQVGALLDAVPHTRDTRVTGTATSQELQGMLQGIEVRRSRYTGPTGISGVLVDALKRSGVATVSLWGHAPHYLQVSPNPKVSLRLINGLQKLLDVRISVESLESQGQNFERRVEQALTDEPEVIAYIQRLEEKWDDGKRLGVSEELIVETSDEEGDMPDADQAVRGIEEFLRQARQVDPNQEDSKDR